MIAIIINLVSILLMIPNIDLNAIKKTGEPKSTKHAQTYSVDRELLTEFKAYCKTNKLAVSPIVESLIRVFMEKVAESEGHR